MYYDNSVVIRCNAHTSVLFFPPPPRQSIVRTIAPSGFLHTFEFNEIRATRAQEEFDENGLGEKPCARPSLTERVEYVIAATTDKKYYRLCSYWGRFKLASDYS